jgi:hypothetical protein
LNLEASKLEAVYDLGKPESINQPAGRLSSAQWKSEYEYD